MASEGRERRLIGELLVATKSRPYVFGRPKTGWGERICTLEAGDIVVLMEHVVSQDANAIFPRWYLVMTPDGTLGYCVAGTDCFERTLEH